MGLLGRGSDSKGQAPEGARPPQQVQMELGQKEAEGIYSNVVIVGHTASEFIFDFARMLPGIPKAKVYARIIMTPQNAKSLLLTLQRSLETFEQKYGKVPTGGESPPPREIGFK